MCHFCRPGQRSGRNDEVVENMHITLASSHGCEIHVLAQSSTIFWEDVLSYVGTSGTYAVALGCAGPRYQRGIVRPLWDMNAQCLFTRFRCVRPCIAFRSKSLYNGELLVALRRIQELEFRPLSVACDCLSNIAIALDTRKLSQCSGI